MKYVQVFIFNIILITFLLISGGCARVYFSLPQPQKGMALKYIPKSITGVYSDSVLTLSLTPDSLFIADMGFQLTKKDPGENQVHIRFYNPYYFASFKDSVYYDVFMGYFYDNKLALYMLNGDQRSVGVLNRAVKVDTLDHEKEIFLINPSRNEFDAMLEWDVWDVIGIYSKK